MHITVKDGLLNNKVTAICQDSNGFLWIGTQTGLQRFDGTRFKNYLADIHDTASLQSDWISSIFEDSKHRLWIGTDHGAAYTLNRSTGKFYNYNLHTKWENKINGIWHFVENKGGELWIGGHDGYYRLNEDNNQFEKYNQKLGLDKNIRTSYLSFDENNNLWMATNDGIKFYNQKEKKLYDRAFNPKKLPLFDLKLNLTNIFIDNNILWASTGYDKLIYKYDFLLNKYKVFSFEKPATIQSGTKVENNFVGVVYRLNNGKIVVPLLETGIAIYQPKLDSFFVVYADNTNPFSYHLSNKIFSSVLICQDKENNILIGNNAGINISNFEPRTFINHEKDIASNKFSLNKPVSGFLEMPDGDILISYYAPNGGIARLDNFLQYKTHYQHIENDSIISGNNEYWCLFKDMKGIVWAASQNKSISKLNPITNFFNEEKDTVLSGPIITIEQDNNNVVWMGHWSKGLVKEELASHKKYFYTQFLYADSSSLQRRVQSILLNGDKIWVGTFKNGLQIFDKKKGAFTEAFVTDEKNKTTISSNCINDILQYTKDTLILATEMGVNIFNLKTKTFKAITAKEGLPNNLVLALMKDNVGFVWAAFANGGFCKINMHNFLVTCYDTNDGIGEDEFTSKFYTLKNGLALIGTNKNFISFNPPSFSNFTPPPDASITGVHIFEKELLVDSLLIGNHPLLLSYTENSLRIEFSLLHFFTPGNISFFYKLEGVDKDWILATNSHTAVYNQLKNGKYIFKVKCQNRDGIFSKNITEFTIIINPPFWKTWWFITMIFCFIFFLLYGLIKWREKNLKTIEAEKLKVQQLIAAQYKSKLEMEQIINYFSSSLINKNKTDDVLWDVAKNLIGQLGFVDCMIYLWNEDKTKMIQKSGFGPKGSIEEINKLVFDVLTGQGVVGYVMATKESVVIPDTATDNRYRPDEIVRLSEIAVPIIYNNELIGVIDSEHPEKNFYTPQHLQILNTIATLVANKIKSIEAEQMLQQAQIEMYSIKEQLSKAKLEALRSQMNPHFIFNSLNAIQECILTNKVDAAYEYLSKFSKLQRMVFNNSEKELIPITSEIEMLQLYLSLESLRFSNSFLYKIDASSMIDTEDIMIPSLITQPFVENAIWHGLRNKEGEKMLLITYTEKNGRIFIIIDDNGIGRGKAGIIGNDALGSSQFASKGTILLQKRLNVLNQQLNANIQLQTIDKKDEFGIATGTQVIISFSINIEKN